jgi:hypothetical protein
VQQRSGAVREERARKIQSTGNTRRKSAILRFADVPRHHHGVPRTDQRRELLLQGPLKCDQGSGLPSALPVPERTEAEQLLELSVH